MRLILPFVATLLLAFSSVALYGQITILDFETPETSTNFQYFGSEIDGELNEIIANPNPTGVNTSSMVATHVKPAGSESWAGAFSNPNPSTPVDLTDATQICMDVHFAQEGSVSLKLENSTNGVANWLQTQPVTTVNDWEQVCFDVSVNGEEDPMTPAAGGIFNTIVVFFDFGMVLDAERTYYFDNITTDGSASDMISLTVNVGTSGMPSVSPDGIFLAGGGNFGEPGDNPMTDPDGDGVYSITVMVASGFESFYTFTNGNCPDYSCKENIAGQDCANPDNFNDRFMGPFTEDTVINTCFGECTTTTECTPFEGGMVTFAVNMNDYTESFTTPFVAGEFNGWAANANPMTDDDGDGVWETTIALSNGDYQYKFQLDEWTVDEQFEGGEDCTVTEGDFVNRTLTVDGDATVCYLWNSCEECNLNSTELLEKGIEFSVLPTLTTGELLLSFGNQPLPQSQLQIVTPQGQVLKQWTLANAYQQTINISSLPAGMYFITLEHEGARGVQRVIKQ